MHQPSETDFLATQQEFTSKINELGRVIQGLTDATAGLFKNVKSEQDQKTLTLYLIMISYYMTVKNLLTRDDFITLYNKKLKDNTGLTDINTTLGALYPNLTDDKILQQCHITADLVPVVKFADAIVTIFLNELALERNKIETQSHELNNKGTRAFFIGLIGTVALGITCIGLVAAGINTHIPTLTGFLILGAVIALLLSIGSGLVMTSYAKSKNDSFNASDMHKEYNKLCDFTMLYVHVCDDTVGIREQLGFDVVQNYEEDSPLQSKWHLAENIHKFGNYQTARMAFFKMNDVEIIGDTEVVDASQKTDVEIEEKCARSYST